MGEAVQANYKEWSSPEQRKWSFADAKITKVRDDGTYDVEFKREALGAEESVPRERIHNKGEQTAREARHKVFLQEQSDRKRVSGLPEPVC